MIETVIGILLSFIVAILVVTPIILLWIWFKVRRIKKKGEKYIKTDEYKQKLNIQKKAEQEYMKLQKEYEKELQKQKEVEKYVGKKKEEERDRRRERNGREDHTTIVRYEQRRQRDRETTGADKIVGREISGGEIEAEHEQRSRIPLSKSIGAGRDKSSVALHRPADL